MEARAVSRHLRIAPRKARGVVDLIRGKNVGEALMILDFLPRKGARLVAKTLKSVIANAESQQRVDVDRLYVRRVDVDGATTLKRFLPRATGARRRCANGRVIMTIVVDERS